MNCRHAPHEALNEPLISLELLFKHDSQFHTTSVKFQIKFKCEKLISPTNSYSFKFTMSL